MPRGRQPKRDLLVVLQGKLETAGEHAARPELLAALRQSKSEEDRLRAFQAIRDAGILPADAGFYLLRVGLDRIADRRWEMASQSRTW